MMEAIQIERLEAIAFRKVQETSMVFRRHLYEEIDWGHRLVSVTGPRGVGKTTLLLQRMKETMQEYPESLYLSLDSICLNERELYEPIEHHVQYGGTHLYLDEVHCMANWQSLLKNLSDDFHKFHIVFAGSSLLRLDKDSADLSRRLLRYGLPGLSWWTRKGI